MRCIQELKDEKNNLESEVNIETLLQSGYRFELEHEASKKVELCQFKSAFSEIKRDDEIAFIVKAIIPNHLKTTLL